MTTALKTAAIKTRPILFSGAMVRAILEGRKTQTRRVLKLPSWASQNWGDFELGDDDLPIAIAANTGCFGVVPCLYGKIGDRLWVREAWRPRSWGSDFDWMMVEFAATEGVSGANKHINPSEVWDTELRAECLWEQLTDECLKAECPRSESGDFTLQGKDGKVPIKWRPSIHMPRAVSRLTLEITEVRVQRLQDISEEDAIAEGIPQVDYGFGYPDYQGSGSYCTAKDSFKTLWDSINAEKYPWDSNPWIWAISFRKVEATP